MKQEYKDLYSKITPDEKLLDDVLERAKKKSAPGIWKKAAAVCLAFALIAGGAGYYGLNNNNAVKEKKSTVSESDDNFSIIAYAKEGGENSIITLSEDDITLTDCKIEIKNDTANNDPNEYYLSSSSETGFAIHSTDVASVDFECEKGSFSYFDGPLQQYMEQNNEYYAVIIPLTEEEGKEYVEQTEKYGAGRKYNADFLSNIMRSRDCSEYFGDNSTDLSLYAIDYSYDDDTGQSVPNAFLLRNIEKTSKLIINHSQSFTAKTYSDGDTIGNVYYYPEQASCLLDQPEISYDKIPADEITISVKFKSGQSITKKLNVSFNKDGYMQLEYIK